VSPWQRGFETHEKDFCHRLEGCHHPVCEFIGAAVLYRAAVVSLSLLQEGTFPE
jgi:hypothetical protein